MQENDLTQMPSDSICTEKGQCSGDGFFFQRGPSEDADQGRYRAASSYLALRFREAFLIHVGSAREAIKKKGYFKSFEDHSDDYSEKRGRVKELKKQLEALK